MSVCTNCGHELGVGRFCVNCGHPIGAPAPAGEPDWRTGTAERPAIVEEPGPIVPPPAHTAPVEAARYPLYADEVLPSPAPAPPAGARPADESAPAHRRGAAWWPWAAGAVVMLLIALLGIQLMFGGGDDPEPVASEPTATREKQERSPSRTPKPSPTEESTAPGEPIDVARFATVDVPATAPPNQDVSGNLVRYEGRNMLDGVPTTCWRMAGDGTGETISFTLDRETTLAEVGLINGYAKTSTDGGQALDWYAGNRRILEVQWAFDDGTVLSQDLVETRTLQVLELDDPVTTSTVGLTLVTVTPPGTGPAARNNTAISDVTLVGTIS
jgi:hypothetical protein